MQAGRSACYIAAVALAAGVAGEGEEDDKEDASSRVPIRDLASGRTVGASGCAAVWASDARERLAADSFLADALRFRGI